MSRFQLNNSFNKTSNNCDADLKALREENSAVKRQMKKAEAEHENIKTVLEQKVGFLEDQIKSYQEREENIKRSNQTIMSVLEDIHKDDSKNGLKLKAIEELEKATNQYNQALLDQKMRMKEDITKLENENKTLKENIIKKDCELNVLRDFIEEIKSGYLSASKNGYTVPHNNKDLDWKYERISTLPDYLEENERWPTIIEKDSKKNSKEVAGYYSIINREANREMIRSHSQMLHTDSGTPKIRPFDRTSPREVDFRHNSMDNFFVRENRMRNVGEADKTKYQSQNLALRSLSSSNMLRIQQEDSKRKEMPFIPENNIIQSSSESVAEDKHEPSNKILSTPNNLEPIVMTPSIQKALMEITLPQMNEGNSTLTKKVEAKAKHHLWSKETCDAKRRSVEQSFCQPRNTEGVNGVQENVPNENCGEVKFAVDKKPSTKVSKNPKQTKQIHLKIDCAEDILQGRGLTYKILDRKKERKESEGILSPKYELMRPHTTKNLTEKACFREENSGSQNEVKYIIEQPLKIAKSRIEKQTTEANMRRPTPVKDPPMLSASINVLKKSVTEGDQEEIRIESKCIKKVASKANIEENNKAVLSNRIERKNSNIYMMNRGARGGAKEEAPQKKSFR